MSCVFCHNVIQKANNRLLVDGKAKFDIRTSLSKLPFNIEIDSIYICRPCLDKLKKLENLNGQLNEHLENLENIYKSRENCAKNREETELSVESLQGADAAKRPRVEPIFLSPLSPVSGKADCSSRDILQSTSLYIAHSTPKKVPSNSAATTSSDTLTPVEVSSETSTSTATVVTVNIQYPSQTRGRNLPNDLQSLGKMLVRGTYKQIANAAWNNLNLRKQLQILAVKHVDNECHSLCSKKKPSCLRSPNKNQLLDFSFEKLEK